MDLLGQINPPGPTPVEYIEIRPVYKKTAQLVSEVKVRKDIMEIDKGYVGNELCIRLLEEAKKSGAIEFEELDNRFLYNGHEDEAMGIRTFRARLNVVEQ